MRSGAGLVLMAFTAATLRAMLVGHGGQNATLRRLGNSPPDDVAVVSKTDTTDVAEQMVAGNISQVNRRFIISTVEISSDGWPAPPQMHDQLIVDGEVFTIQNSKPMVGNVFGVVIGYRLETLGA